MPALINIYLLLLLAVSIIGFTKYSIVGTAERVIIILLAITSISETTAHFLISYMGRNLIVYHIYDPIQFFLVCLFFNYSIKAFNKRKIGLVIGLSGVIISLVNSIFFQKFLTDFNSNFTLFESISIIAMSLYYFYDYLSNKDNTLYTFSFWTTCILFLFWSFTFFRWLAEFALPELAKEQIFYIIYMMWFINMITYSAFGLVFLFYKKLQPVE